MTKPEMRKDPLKCRLAGSIGAAGSMLDAMTSLFDTVNDTVFFVKDSSARYVSVSQTLADRCSCRNREELIGKTVLDLFTRPMAQAYYEQDMQVIKTGNPLRNELELHLYIKGTPGWCVTSKMPIRDEIGNIIGLLGISKDLNVSEKNPKGYKDIAVAIRHIRTRFGESLRIEELARMTSLSIFQFEQRIKKIFGVTPAQFLATFRIDAARDMLQNTRKQISEIALSCGFYDQSALNRQFKAITGLTPTQYRAQSNASSSRLQAE
jgi:AraC-like DNA-binding protein